MSATDHDDIPRIALDWHRQGRGAALATVVETWGSAPRPVGAQLAISGAGDIAGSVSGGCVEGAVVMEAVEALATGGARMLEFGVSDDEAFAVGLACGGRIRVLVEPVGDADLAPDLLADLVARRAAQTPVAYVVDLETWARRLDGPEAHHVRFRSDRSGVDEDGRTFVALHNSPLRLIVVGGVHIAQPLLKLADLAGYASLLIDPRDSFAALARFPDRTISHDWPDAAIAAAAPDARTAVVTLTHDPKLDDPAIRAALASPAFYIGCLGSTRTHAKRRDRLADLGTALDRLHAPVGLAIGARTPGEIAVAILAQITQVLRQG